MAKAAGLNQWAALLNLDARGRDGPILWVADSSRYRRLLVLPKRGSNEGAEDQRNPESRDLREPAVILTCRSSQERHVRFSDSQA